MTPTTNPKKPAIPPVPTCAASALLLVLLASPAAALSVGVPVAVPVAAPELTALPVPEAPLAVPVPEAPPAAPVPEAEPDALASVALTVLLLENVPPTGPESGVTFSSASAAPAL